MALVVFLYGVFLLGAVAHTVARAAAEQEIQDSIMQLGSLETAYLLEIRALSLERARSLGFVLPAAVTTVYAHTDGALSLYGTP